MAQNVETYFIPGSRHRMVACRGTELYTTVYDYYVCEGGGKGGGGLDCGTEILLLVHRRTSNTALYDY